MTSTESVARETAAPDEVWDSLFHACAWAAYLELAVATGGPPPSDLTRRRAYRLYEDELARRNRERSANRPVPLAV